MGAVLDPRALAQEIERLSGSAGHDPAGMSDDTGKETT